MVMERAKLFGGMVFKSKTLALIISWSFLVSLLMIKNHQLFYMQNQRFTVYKIAYDKLQGPMFTDLDWAILLITSFIVGMFIPSARKMVYSYFGVVGLSFLIGTLYVYLYNWFVLDLGEMLSRVAYGWEWGLYIAFLNILRFMFPAGMFACLIGLASGSFLAVWIRTS